jgi:hypothetical protein
MDKSLNNEKVVYRGDAYFNVRYAVSGVIVHWYKCTGCGEKRKVITESCIIPLDALCLAGGK